MKNNQIAASFVDSLIGHGLDVSSMTQRNIEKRFMVILEMEVDKKYLPFYAMSKDFVDQLVYDGLDVSAIMHRTIEREFVSFLNKQL